MALDRIMKHSEMVKVLSEMFPDGCLSLNRDNELVLNTNYFKSDDLTEMFGTGQNVYVDPSYFKRNRD